MRRVGALAVWLMVASCGGDGGAETETLSGVVSLVDDDRPLAGVSVRAMGKGKAATSDANGRFSVSVPRGSSVRMEAANVAPVTRENWRTATPTLRMKAYDGSGAVSAALGGSVAGLRGAAVRMPAGAIAGAVSAEVAIAAPDPRNPAALRAVTGSFKARTPAATGRLSVVSPMYVGTRDQTAARLAPATRFDVDFAAWAEVDVSRLALYAFDDSTEEWSQVGTVATALNAGGTSVYRAISDRLGWLAVGFRRISTRMLGPSRSTTSTRPSTTSFQS